MPGLFECAASDVDDTTGYRNRTARTNPSIALAGGTASLLTQALSSSASDSVFTCSKAAPYYCTSGLSTVGPRQASDLDGTSR